MWHPPDSYLLISKDHSENIKDGSFQPTLWLSSAVEVDIKLFNRDIHIDSYFKENCYNSCPHKHALIIA